MSRLQRDAIAVTKGFAWHASDILARCHAKAKAESFKGDARLTRGLMCALEHGLPSNFALRVGIGNGSSRILTSRFRHEHGKRFAHCVLTPQYHTWHVERMQSEPFCRPAAIASRQSMDNWQEKVCKV